ncbi:MAG: CoA-binding protein [Bdellovibrionales bacterium]
MGQKVAILGASPKPERYSNKAFHMLQEYGHTVLPVAPSMRELEGVKVFATLGEIHESVDTLTMYVGAAISSGLEAAILKLKPARVIFNPGSENPALQAVLVHAGIEVEEACTLVLLRSNQF